MTTSSQCLCVGWAYTCFLAQKSNINSSFQSFISSIEKWPWFVQQKGYSEKISKTKENACTEVSFLTKLQAVGLKVFSKVAPAQASSSFWDSCQSSFFWNISEWLLLNFTLLTVRSIFMYKLLVIFSIGNLKKWSVVFDKSNKSSLINILIIVI